MGSRILDPGQAVIVQVRENSGQGACFPLVFSFRTGVPGFWIKMLQQKLVHAIICGIGFQQNFANVSFGLGPAVSHERSIY